MGNKRVEKTKKIPQMILPIFRKSNDYMTVFESSTMRTMNKAINKPVIYSKGTETGTTLIDNLLIKFDKYVKGTEYTGAAHKFTYLASEALFRENSNLPKLKKRTAIEMNQINSFVTIPISEYMENRGLKSRHRAIEELEKIFPLLGNMSLEDKEIGRIGYWGTVRFDNPNNKKNIVVDFTKDFAADLIDGHFRDIPKLAIRSDGKKFPSASPLLFYISAQIELGNSVFSVKKLLENCSFPSYERVKKENRNYTARIREPLEKTLDYLSSELNWEFCKKKGAPIPQNELESKDFNVFLDWYVKIEYKT